MVSVLSASHPSCLVLSCGSSHHTSQVFKILWSEPLGQNAVTNRKTPLDSEFNDNGGQTLFVGFRHFIVVAADEDSLTCV